MRIRRDDIEPKMLARLMAGMGESFAHPHPTPVEHHARQLSDKLIYKPIRDRVASGIGTALGWMFGGFAGTIALMATPAGDWSLIPLILCSGIGLCLSIRREIQTEDEDKRVHPEVLKAWLPLL